MNSKSVYEKLVSRKISIKLLFFTLIFSTIITFGITAMQLYTDYRNGKNSIQKQLILIESSYVASLSQSIWVYDTEQIELQLEGVLHLADIVYASVALPDGSTYERGNISDENTINKFYPIDYKYASKNTKLGELFVVADLNKLYEELETRVVVILLSQGIKTFLTSFFILFIFQRLVTNHLQRIVEYTRSLELTENFSPLVLNKNVFNGKKDELDELTDSINEMQIKLNRSYEEITDELEKRTIIEKELLVRKDELKVLYNTDKLTSLGNRNKLIEDIQKNPNSSLAIIDIDNFKEINDFYGNKTGDTVIIEYANRLIKHLKMKSTEVYRLHADQFAVLHKDNISNEEFEFYLRQLIKKTTEESIVFEHYDVIVGVTVGIAIDEKPLYISADLALKKAKSDKRSFVTYSKEFNIEKEYEINLLWTKKLRKALNESRVIAYFQPIYNQKTNKIEKFEALVRMIEVDGKVISPYFFLGIAIKSKQYSQITKIMIDAVVEATLNHDYEFSINFTMDDINNKATINYFTKKIQENKIGHKVVVEIVETEGIENFTEMDEFISSIKTLGCKIAIDDFGTGYSNFEYLLRLKADYIKIDGSLIKDIDKDKDMHLVVENIISFSRIANMKTIAEFVCNEEVKNTMKKLDVDYLQGYEISEPVKYEDIVKFKT